MTRTELVLDLPQPAGLRVVIVDHEAVVDECLAMVLRQFGVLVTSGPGYAAEPGGDMAAPHVRISEVVGASGPISASVQRLAMPGGAPVGFEMTLADPRAAIALALALDARDPLLN
jgi:hypothetical protein